jgi:hypothetical protein
MRKQIPLSLLGALLLAGLTSGCNTVYVTPKEYLGVPNYPPTDPRSVEVLHVKPTAAHVRLGEVMLQPQGNPTKAQMEEKLRLAASSMGANALVIVADRTMIFGATDTAAWWGRAIPPDVGRVIVAVAIRYTH